MPTEQVDITRDDIFDELENFVTDLVRRNNGRLIDIALRIELPEDVARNDGTITVLTIAS